MNLLVMKFSTLSKWAIFLLITVISENASSRKLGNWNWFSQPLVHTVMGRNSCPTGTRPTITVWTCGWENPVLVFQLPGKDTFFRLKKLYVKKKYWFFSRTLCLFVNDYLLHTVFRQFLQSLLLTLDLKMKKLSTNSPRDFNSVLDTIKHYWVDPA